METLLPELLKLGPPGILCAVLAYAWYTSEKRNDAYRDRLQQVNDAFLESTKDTVKHIESNTNTLTTMRAMQQERGDDSRDIRSQLDQISNQIKAIHAIVSTPRRRQS